jgi:hypothetical protein
MVEIMTRTKSVNLQKDIGFKLLSTTDKYLDLETYDLEETDIIFELNERISDLVNCIYDESIDINYIHKEFFSSQKLNELLRIIKNTEIRKDVFSNTEIKSKLEEISVDDFARNVDDRIKRIFTKTAAEKQISIEYKAVILDHFLKKGNLSFGDTIYILMKGKVFVELGDAFDRSVRVKKHSFRFKPLPHKTGNRQKSVSLICNSEINYTDLITKNTSEFEKAIIVLVTIFSVIDSISEMIDTIFFDNVRLFVKNQAVDNSITDSIKNNPNDFHILHNGISIICEDFSFIREKVIIDGASIVNGAQTLFNIIKMVNTGVINIKSLRSTYLIVKILKLKQGERNIKPSDISIAANTQKSVSEYDLKSNHEFSKKLAYYFSSQGVDLIIKRGQKTSQKTSIKTFELIKLLYAAFYQLPGYARNAKRDSFFTDSNGIFENLYFCGIDPTDNSANSTTDKQIQFRARFHVYLLYTIWLEYKKNLKSDMNVPFILYGEKYAIAYAFGKTIIDIMKGKKSKLDLGSMNNDLREATFVQFNDIRQKISLDQSDYDNENLTSNDFKKETLYMTHFKEYEKVQEYVLNNLFPNDDLV